MDNNAFVFYNNWYEGIRQMPSELQIQAYNMIARYGLYGEEPSEDTNWALRAFFYGDIKKAIDENTRRYEELSHKRSEAGKRAMEKRWHNKNNNVTNGITSDNNVTNGVTSDNNDTNVITSDNNDTNVITSDNKVITEDNNDNNTNRNRNRNRNRNTTTNNLRSVTTSSSTSEEVDAEEELNKKRNDFKNKANAIIDYYNEQIKAEGAKLRLCEARTETRLGFITARLKDYGEEKVKNVIDKAVLSHALNYDLRIAPVDIEWIMRPNNFPKVMEGAYNNRDTQSLRSREYDLMHFEGENTPDIYEEIEKKINNAD